MVISPDSSNTSTRAAFTTSQSVRLHHTDAAGVVFFTEPLRFCHDAYEDWLKAHGLTIRAMLDERQFALPIAESHARLSRPMRVGDIVEVAIRSGAILADRFTLHFALSVNGRPTGHCSTLHICINPANSQTQPLPDAITQALSLLAVHEHSTK